MGGRIDQQDPLPQGRVFVLVVQPDGTRLAAELYGAEATIITEMDDAYGGYGLLQRAGSARHSMRVEGDLDTWDLFSEGAPLPNEQPVLSPGRPAIERPAPIAAGPGA